MLKRAPNWRIDWLIPVSAVLVVLSFPPYELTPLVWICLIPWFFAIRRAKDVKHAVIQGLWLSFFTTIMGFHWVARVLHQYGNIPWPLSVAGLLGFGLFCQPQFVIFSALLKKLENKLHESRATSTQIITFALLAALAYTGLDWAMPKLFVDTLGHVFYAHPRLVQLADVGGAPMLTFIVYLVNEFFLRSLMFKKVRPAHAITCALVVGAAFSYGHVRLGQIRDMIREIQGSSRDTVQFAAIQGNIGDFDKVAAERGVRGAARKVLETYFTMSDQALAMSPKPEVLVWPETSYPSTFRTPETQDELERDRALENFARERGVPLLFGGYDHANGYDYNSFFFLSPEAQPGLASQGDLKIYHKNILLLFGEYIPGARQIKFLKALFPQVGNFGQGPGPEVVEVRTNTASLKKMRAGPVICYEALFPRYVIGAARKGSNLILNITNDSWFGPYGEPQLHLALSVFRSVETRLPQLRATNTGISALIMPDGAITQRTGLERPEIMNVAVPMLAPIPTLMKAWGDWFGLFALVVGFGGLGGIGLVASRRRRHAI